MARAIIELSVVVVGWLLGGPAGNRHIGFRFIHRTRRAIVV